MHWRAVFTALAALVRAVQVARSRTDALAAPARDLAADLTALGLRPAASPVRGTLAARAPGCAGDIFLTQVDFSGLGETRAQALLAPPDMPRFVNLGFVGAQANTASIGARWAAGSLLHAFGLRPTAVPRQVVLLLLPQTCPRLVDLDWSRLSPWE